VHQAVPVAGGPEEVSVQRVIERNLIMDKINNAVLRFLRDEEGQDIIEYGLLAAFIAVVVAAILALMSPQLSTIYNGILAQLTAAAKSV
jgi:Flp pilus assembly pilin Flp